MTRISFITPDLRRIDGAGMHALCIFRFSEKEPLRGIAGLYDWRLYGHLSKLAIEGFLTGASDESLLMPLERQIGADALLVFGMGPKSDFSKHVFTAGLTKLFDTLIALDYSRVAVSLPGRIDELCSPEEAMEWLTECIDTSIGCEDILIVETAATQEVMIPVLERWRLRQLVPYSDG